MPDDPEREARQDAKPAPRCERCGRFDEVIELEGHTLCAGCLQGCGSCCPEFGADDLWPR